MGFRLDIKPSKSRSWCRLHKRRTHSLKYLEKSILKIHAANGAILKVNYKLPKVHVCFQGPDFLLTCLHSRITFLLNPKTLCSEGMFTIINDKGVIRFCTKPVHQPKKLYHTKKTFINNLTAKIGNTRI